MKEEDFTGFIKEDFFEMAVMLEITALQRQGGPTAWHVEEAQRRMQSLRDADVAESILYVSKDTRQSFQIYVEAIAVLAFVEGGITVAGKHFEAPGGIAW